MFIEVRAGLNVKVSEIEAVEVDHTDSLKSFVYTHHTLYKSDIPAESIIELMSVLSRRDDQEGKEEKSEEKKLTSQYWAG